MSDCQHLRLTRTIVGETAFYKCSDGWISVTERLPESGQVVIVRLARKNTVSQIDVMAFKKDAIDGIISWKAPYCNYWQTEVTHWQPLPPLPDSACHRNFTARASDHQSLVSRAACGGSPMMLAIKIFYRFAGLFMLTLGISLSCAVELQFLGFPLARDVQDWRTGLGIVAATLGAAIAFTLAELYEAGAGAEPRAQEEGREIEQKESNKSGT